MKEESEETKALYTWPLLFITILEGSKLEVFLPLLL